MSGIDVWFVKYFLCIIWKMEWRYSRVIIMKKGLRSRHFNQFKIPVSVVLGKFELLAYNIYKIVGLFYCLLYQSTIDPLNSPTFYLTFQST